MWAIDIQRQIWQYKVKMTDGGENCQVKVPAVLLLEMTSAYI